MGDWVRQLWRICQALLILAGMETGGFSAKVCEVRPLSEMMVCQRPYSWFAEAGIPSELWPEFAAVAACESSLRPDNGTGDGGAAKGLFQIHWHLWQPWAETIDPAFSTVEWDDPVHNAALAYLIQEEYSLPRRADRWSQWTAQPDWPLCQQKLAGLTP